MLLLILLFVTMQLLVECQLNNIFLNHLSLVEQSTHKNVECSRFSVLHVWQIFCLVVSLDNLEFFIVLQKLCYISSHIQSLTVYFLRCHYVFKIRDNSRSVHASILGDFILQLSYLLKSWISYIQDRQLEKMKEELRVKS